MMCSWSNVLFLPSVSLSKRLFKVTEASPPMVSHFVLTSRKKKGGKNTLFVTAEQGLCDSIPECLLRGTICLCVCSHSTTLVFV